MSKKVYQNIIKEVAEELGYNERTIQGVVDSEFKFSKNTIVQGEYRHVHLPGFGKFAVKHMQMERHKAWKAAAKEKRANEDDNQ